MSFFSLAAFLTTMYPLVPFYKYICCRFIHRQFHICYECGEQAQNGECLNCVETV